MFEIVHAAIPLLGRLLLGGAFVFAGLRNLGNIPYLAGSFLLVIAQG